MEAAGREGGRQQGESEGEGGRQRGESEGEGGVGREGGSRERVSGGWE